MKNQQSLGGGARGFLPIKGKNCWGEGFTLAEVLITLGIIGVVAAMTMPTIMSNYRKKQAVVQLKKAYSEISQALTLAQTEFGMIEDWDFTNIPFAERSKYFAQNFLLKNIKTIKVCNPTSPDCWKEPVNTSGRLAMCRTEHLGGNYISFISSSGYSVFSWVAVSGHDGGVCVDLNGPSKGDSIVGKDVFLIYFNSRMDDSRNPGVFMYGGFKKNILSRDELLNDPTYGCATVEHDWGGAYCGLLIQRDGWEIKDDYPWK